MNARELRFRLRTSIGRSPTPAWPAVGPLASGLMNAVGYKRADRLGNRLTAASAAT